MAKAKYSTLCREHGIHNKDTNMYNVAVGKPRSKKERLHGGCPYCKATKK